MSARLDELRKKLATAFAAALISSFEKYGKAAIADAAKRRSASRF
jgi:hypothetical protein